MKKIGLIFSGGGGKGAYEAGVWKALREYKIDQYVGAVAGTSVGGLNAALFHQGDLEKAEKVWRNISNDAILKINKEDILKSMTGLGLPTVASFIAPVLDRLVNRGIFSQSGLEQLIRANVDLEALSASKMPITVCALNTTTKQPEYLKLNGRPADEIVNCLLASAAIPGIFKKIEINGTNYLDGGVIPGFEDNTPIAAVSGEGCDLIISIMLDQTTSTLNHELENKNAHVWKIVPSQDLGGIFDGSLDFSPEGAARRFELGYHDACTTLQRVAEFLEIEHRFREKTSEFGNQIISFKTDISENPQLRERINDMSQKSYKGMNTLQFLLDFSPTEGNQLKIEANTGTEVILSEQKDISALLEEHEKALITDKIDLLIEDLHDNSLELEKLAFEGITALSPVEARVNAINKKGFFAKLWGTFSNSNIDTINQSVHDLSKAIYCNQEMIKKLADRSALTFDALISMNNHIAYLQTQAQNTQLQFQQVYSHLGNMQLLIGQFINQVNEKFSQVNDRLDQLENIQAIHNWRMSLTGYQLNGIPYAELSTTEKITVITCEFFGKLKGEISNESLPLFKSALNAVNTDLKEEISISAFFDNFNSSKNLQSHCLEKSLAYEQIFPLPAKTHSSTPLIAGMEHISSHPDLSSEKLLPTLRKNTFLPEKLPAYNLAAELLFNLRASFRPEGHSHAEKLTFSLETAARHLHIEGSQKNLLKNIQNCIQEIKTFKLKIPLIGEFSAGKSTLINNALLPSRGQFLKVETSAETALATELHYSKEEGLLLHYLDGRTEKAPLSQLEATKNQAEKLLFVEVFLNQPELRTLGDIVPVDMPGLNSSLQAHDKAILSYLEEGTFYLITISADTGDIKASLRNFIGKELKSYGLNCAILITKSDYKTAGDLEKIRIKIKTTAEELFGREVFVGTTTTREPKQINDFHSILAKVRGSKDHYLLERFLPQVKNLIEESSSYYAKILAQENISAEEMAIAIEKLENQLPKMEKELGFLLDDLQYALLNDGLNELYSKATASLNSDALYHAAKAGSQQLQNSVSTILRPILANGVKSVVNDKLQDFQRQIEKLAKSAEASADGSFAFAYEPFKVEKSAQVGKTAGGAAAGAAAGMVLGPIGAAIGGIVGGIIGFFSGKKNNAEAEFLAQLNSQIIPQVHQQARNCIQQALTSAYTNLDKAIKKKFTEDKDDHLNGLKELQKKKAENEEEFKGKSKQWQSALEELQRVRLDLTKEDAGSANELQTSFETEPVLI